MQLEELFLPWLGAHVLALLGGQDLAVNTINSWSSRGLITHMGEIRTGRNRHRLYSLGAAIQIHAMHRVITQGGLTAAAAVQVGNACVQRLMQVNDETRDGRDSIRTDEQLLAFYFDGKTIKGAFVSADDVPDIIERSDLPGFLAYCTLFAVDHLIDVVVNNYFEPMTRPLNDQALARNVKPFPKTLQGLVLV